MNVGGKDKLKNTGGIMSWGMFIAVQLVLALPIMILWNWVLPEGFEIGYIKALGVIALVKMFK